MNRDIVPELLQERATVANITAAALALLDHPEKRLAMQAGYAKMRAAMGTPGVVDRAATEILDLLSNKKVQDPLSHT